MSIIVIPEDKAEKEGSTTTKTVRLSINFNKALTAESGKDLEGYLEIVMTRLTNEQYTTVIYPVLDSKET